MLKAVARPILALFLMGHKWNPRGSLTLRYDRGGELPSQCAHMTGCLPGMPVGGC